MNNDKPMTAKEYLAQANNLDRRIDSKLDQLTKLRASATKATATISDMPRADSPPLQSMESTVVKIIGLEAEITDDIDALVDIKRDLMTMFKRIPSLEDQLVLEQRYLCNKTWVQVAEFLDCDSRYIHKLRIRCTRKFEKIFSECAEKTLNDTIDM